jgi:hypothetical protein
MNQRTVPKDNVMVRRHLVRDEPPRKSGRLGPAEYALYLFDAAGAANDDLTEPLHVGTMKVTGGRNATAVQYAVDDSVVAILDGWQIKKLAGMMSRRKQFRNKRILRIPALGIIGILYRQGQADTLALVTGPPQITGRKPIPLRAFISKLAALTRHHIELTRQYVSVSIEE